MTNTFLGPGNTEPACSCREELEALRPDRDQLVDECVSTRADFSEALSRHAAQQNDIEALKAERDQLRAKADTDALYAKTLENRIADLESQHDARVAELLEASNREVERRREAENERNDILTNHIPKFIKAGFLMARIGDEAADALIEGRAAVVPLISQSAIPEHWMCWEQEVDAVRLDKPVEDK